MRVDDNNKEEREKIFLRLKLAKEKFIPVHIKSFDGGFSNGYIKHLSHDFIIIDERKNGVESIFLMDIKSVSPFRQTKEDSVKDIEDE